MVPVGVAGDGSIYYLTRATIGSAPAGRQVRYTEELHRAAADGESTVKLLETPGILAYEGPYGESAAVPFGGETLTAIADSSIYVLRPLSDAVECYDFDGRLKRRQALPVGPYQLSEATKSAERQRLLADISRSHEGVPERFVEGRRRAISAMSIPDSLSPVSRLIADRDGALLIEVVGPPVPAGRTSAGSSVFWYDDAGSLRGSLVLPVGADVIGFGAGRVVLLHRDSVGVERVTVHRLPQRD
jgi:hypothetical protein